MRAMFVIELVEHWYIHNVSNYLIVLNHKRMRTTQFIPFNNFILYRSHEYCNTIIIVIGTTL